MIVHVLMHDPTVRLCHIFSAGHADRNHRSCSTGILTCRILDWFHIAMKIRALDLTACRHRGLLAPNGRELCEEIASCKWLVWHGKATKAVSRLKRINDAFGIVAAEPYFTLWMNLGRLIGYLESNDRYHLNVDSTTTPASSASQGLISPMIFSRSLGKRLSQATWSCASTTDTKLLFE